MQHIEGDTGQQMAQLDQRTRQIIDDLKNNITTYQNHADVEREKLEGKLQVALENHAQIRDSVMVSLQPASVAQLDARLTGDQEVASSTLAGSATFFRGDLIMKYFLRSFSPFR